MSDETKQEYVLPLLIDRYGFRLTIGNLAEVLKITPAEVRNRISADTLGINTVKEREGRSGPRYADVRDVAEYLDTMRQKAASPNVPGQFGYKSLKSANANR